MHFLHLKGMLPLENSCYPDHSYPIKNAWLYVCGTTVVCLEGIIYRPIDDYGKFEFGSMFGTP
jgi:hypothetical protein